MNGHTKLLVATAAGCLVGWLANAQLVQGQGQQKDSPVKGQLSHLGFAVTDVEKTAAAFAKAFGVENVPKSQDFREIKWGPHFPGKVMHVRRMGMTINGVTIELLQPLEGDSPWKEFIAKGGDGLHHVGFSVPDVKKAKDHLESMGGMETQEFQAPGAPAPLAYYVDMHKAGVPITFEVTPGAPPAAPAAPK